MALSVEEDFCGPAWALKWKKEVIVGSRGRAAHWQSSLPLVGGSDRGRSF